MQTKAHMSNVLYHESWMYTAKCRNGKNDVYNSINKTSYCRYCDTLLADECFRNYLTDNGYKQSISHVDEFTDAYFNLYDITELWERYQTEISKDVEVTDMIEQTVEEDINIQTDKSLLDTRSWNAVDSNVPDMDVIDMTTSEVADTYTLSTGVIERAFGIEEPTDKPVENIGRKNDAIDDKLRMDLIPLDCLEDIAKVYTEGAKKYGDNNWKSLDNGYERYKGALLRHLCAAERSEFDDETNCRHLAQVAWNAMAMLWYSKHNAQAKEHLQELVTSNYE